MSKSKVVICPYCGEAQQTAERCRVCGGFFEPLSRQATHNAMGPWFIRDARLPFQPGCSYETLVTLIERKIVDKFSVVRGPTTKQFWTVARRVPGISHLLGYCHHCDASVDSSDHGCHACGVSFGAYLDRNYLGLPEIRPLPWEADIDHDDRETGNRRMPVDWQGDQGLQAAGVGSIERDQKVLQGGQQLAENLGIATQTLPSPAPMPASLRTPLPSPGSAGTPTTEAHEGVLVRSLQRQLARQQRNARNLTMVLIASLILFSVVGIALFTSARPGPGPTQNVAPPAQQASPPAATPTAPELTDEPLPAVPDEPVTVPLDEASMQVLHQRIESAADEALELEARIESYEQISVTIDEMLAVPRSDEDAQVLTDLREQVVRDLQRLKMQQFFP